MVNSATITIAERFCGPPDSGNGGYVCGLLAAHVEGQAEVTLRLPPPLKRPLAVEARGDGVVLLDGDAVVAEATPTTLDVDAPAPVSYDDAVAASRRSLALDEKSPFRTCFVCGSRRDEGDDLRIFPGELDGRGVAAPWTPDASLVGNDGVVRPEFVWAALDCPSGFGTGFGPERVAVLGKFAATSLAPVVAGERYVVNGWSRGEDGRKLYSASALFTDGGELRAYARATWITVNK